MAVDLAQQFKEGRRRHSCNHFVGVLEIKGSHLQTKLSLLAVFSTPLNGSKNSAAGLQRLGYNVPAGSQDLSDLEQGGSHDSVGKLPLSQKCSTRSIADNVEVGLGIVHLELLLGCSGCLGIEIKDTDFDVIGDSKFVAIQENNRRPLRVQVVENSKGSVGREKEC